jgi:hypothetical protein
VSELALLRENGLAALYGFLNNSIPDAKMPLFMSETKLLRKVRIATKLVFLNNAVSDSLACAIDSP